MTYGYMTLKAIKIFLTERLCDETHRSMKGYLSTVSGRDTSRLLPAMLQRKKTEIDNVCHIVARRINANYPACLARRITFQRIELFSLRQWTLHNAAPVAPPRLR